MFDHPYAAFLSRLERPGRYLGGEFGSAPVKSDPDVRIALAFPDAYEIGMSHIGLSILYEIINGAKNLAAERVFMPWTDLEGELVARNLPLVSLESATPLSEFDLVGFSLPYELCYTNVIAMLDLGRIPRRAADRKEGDPIIIVGGPVACHSEPIAPFVDLVFVGDGEEGLPGLLALCASEKKRGRDRASRIDSLGRLPFVYAPHSLARKRDEQSRRLVVKMRDAPAAVCAKVADLGAQPTGLGPVPVIKSVFDRYSFEVMRGCTAGCRFCQAGFLYRPVRERSEGQAASAVERACDCLGFDEVSLTGLSTADHSRIRPVIEELGNRFIRRGVSFSLPSLRANGLDEKLVDVVARGRATNVTLAPEAGSQRLRDVINKNITEADLMEAAQTFFARGITKIKLYFMIGLPTETESDLLEIIELAARLRQFGSKVLSGRQPKVTVSVSTFVPKPFTPFEREKMIGIEEIHAKQNLLRTLGRRQKLDVRVHGPELSILEAVFCRGDVSLAPLLEQAVTMGARFDSWGEMHNAEVWGKVLSNVDTLDQLGEIPANASLPWDHVDMGIKSEFLAKERGWARAAKPTPQCGRYVTPDAQDKTIICHACGMGCRPASVPRRSPVISQRAARPPGENGPPARVRKIRPQPSLVAGRKESVRTRLFYGKWGRQSYIGHLDTMRHILYSLRRAGFSLAYTQGFHPKPKMESAPPLPLGTAGLCEPIDVYIVDPPSANEILARLADAVPLDLAFSAVSFVKAGAKSLSKTIERYDYVAFVRASRHRASSGVRALLSAPEMVFERTRKGRITHVDIRPYLLSAGDFELPPEEVRLPPDSTRVGIQFSLAVPGSGGAKPIEVIRAVFGDVTDPWIVRRSVALEED